MGKQKKTAPEAYQVRISDTALKNIDEITGFIAFINHEPLNAIKVGDKIFDTIGRIAQNPHAFRECEELSTKSKMYRRAICLSWLIIYKVTAKDITILGVIHGSRSPSGIKKLSKAK
jgi:plasmid stabilization system protein ParE